MQELLAAFRSPVYALPVDLFRILAGLLALAYFARILYDCPDLSDPDGLIDHRLSQRIFPPTRLSLFQPGIPGQVFRPVFLLACIAAVCVVVGFHTKVAAALLFLVAVSTYRWNLFAVYVDDAIVHLVFFWLLLLPVGTTLTIQDWLHSGTASVGRWYAATVPGASVRSFLLNMALVYVAAGLYKFTSPMWRNGSALHAILKMPIAWKPDLWRVGHGPFLRVFNYWALIMEPLFPLMYVLPSGSPAKWFFVLSTAAFHVGIIATLKIPFANLAMLGAIPIALTPEIMHSLLGQPVLAHSETDMGLSTSGLLAVGLVACLTLMILWEVFRSWLRNRGLDELPLWKTHMSGFLGNPFYVLLWLFGIAQSYRLFDWIDKRNYHVRYEVLVSCKNDSDGQVSTDACALFPRSLRHLLLQSYLLGNVWLQLDAEQLQEVRRSLLTRHAQRFARLDPDPKRVEVYSISQRVTSDNLSLSKGERRLLTRFHCEGGLAVLDPSSMEA